MKNSHFLSLDCSFLSIEAICTNLENFLNLILSIQRESEATSRDNYNIVQKKRKSLRVTRQVSSKAVDDSKKLCVRKSPIQPFDYSLVKECPICFLANRSCAKAFSEHLETHIQELLGQISDKYFQELVNDHFLHQIRIRSFIEQLENQDISAYPDVQKLPKS